MPTTFDEAVDYAAEALYSWGDFDISLAYWYGKLKAEYFTQDGDVYPYIGDSAPDPYLVNLFNIAQRAGKLPINYIKSTVISKQHDYGHDNIAQFGEVGLVVRLADKVARIGNLQGREAQNESLRDSYLDVCGYTVLFRMWRDGTFLLPLASQPRLGSLDNPTRTVQEAERSRRNLPGHLTDGPNGRVVDTLGVDVGNRHGGW